MEGSVKERLMIFIDKKLISVREFERSIKVSNGYLRQLKQCPKKDIMERICLQYPELNITWLLTGEGDIMIMTQNNTRKDNTEKELPLFPYDAMAGVLSGTGCSAMEYECERFVVPSFQDADFLVRVQGDSMEPRYFSGDIVACRKVNLDRLWFQWGKTYVIGTSQGTLIKTLKEGRSEDSVTIVSNNEKYPPFQLPVSEINNNGIAIVIGLIRIE